MLKDLFRRIRARLDLFVRTHIVADEKDLWPNMSTWELQELDFVDLDRKESGAA